MVPTGHKNEDSSKKGCFAQELPPVQAPHTRGALRTILKVVCSVFGKGGSAICG